MLSYSLEAAYSTALWNIAMPSPSPCSPSSRDHVAPSHVEWLASGCGIKPNTRPEGSHTPAMFRQLWFGDVGYGNTSSLALGYSELGLT